MPHRAERSLAEVSALGVLQMRSSCNERDLCICQRRADERAAVILFVKVREYQPLPIDVKRVLGQASVKYQPRALWLRLKQELNLGVVAERLEMSDADRSCGYLFLVNYLSRAKLDLDAEAVVDHSLEQIYLYLSHKQSLDLPRLVIPT